MDYLGNKILGVFTLIYVFVMGMAYGFMLVANMYESMLAAFVSFMLLLLLTFIGIVEYDAEFFDNLYKGTKKSVRS